MNDETKRKISMAITAVLMILLILYDFVLKNKMFTGLVQTHRTLLNTAITRVLGGLIFIVLTLYIGYKIMNPLYLNKKGILFSLPAIIIALNNMPIIPLITGQAKLEASGFDILLLAFECFSIGLFEEFAFRGVIFLGVLEKRRENTRGLFVSIIISSAVFGAIHLLNLFTSSPGAVILQIGYSFLIGAMCSVVLIHTSNIWLCVIIHGVYDFCGSLIPTFGKGTIWTAEEVTLTAVLGVAAAVYFILLLYRTDVRITDKLYN